MNPSQTNESKSMTGSEGSQKPLVVKVSQAGSTRNNNMPCQAVVF